jgi:trehalose 6-phosphate phosphatase
VTVPGVLGPLVDQPAAAALVTDFDGTLAPIVDDPTRARPLPAAVRALEALAGSLAVVGVVSGRPVEFLRAHLPADGLVLVGQYGLERLVDGHVVEDERAETYVAALAAAADEAARQWPDLLLERKGTLSFAVHWRTHPGAAPAPHDLQTLAARHGLLVLPGRMAAEIRVPVRVDKGAALSRLLDEHEVRTCAFAGDDHGDLPAFAALTDRAEHEPGFVGVRIGVRSPEAPAELLARADYVVESPADLARLLEGLADAVSGPR